MKREPGNEARLQAVSLCIQIDDSCQLEVMVEIFVKSWKRPSELNFVVLNFVVRYYTFVCV